ncbi:LysR family transcriptional regulator [Vibrio owensii]|uniref:LysR family transcriptional regulator n=1 Tax=Vibrio owensii TaxID=696485 RepID=UPI000EFAE68E|nr:LysR family transcriptional regulator [Vibrio owensii]AYO19782.1 LysR family transcriptional regulator [Vibrio owensii]
MKATLDEMNVFVSVVDTGSISAAAELLSLTTSATSRALARLESKLNTTLLNRTTRRIELTEEGQLYLDRVRKILASVDEAEDMLVGDKGKPSGLLRVNAASPFMLHVVAPLVAQYQQEYPEIELELTSNEENIDLLGKRTDIAIRIGQLKDSTMRAARLATSSIRVLASPEYLAQHGNPKSVKELEQHRLLGFSRFEFLNDWPLQTEEGELLRIKPVVKAESGETLRVMALKGDGIVCLSDFMTQDDRRNGRLVEVLPESHLDIRQPIHAVYYANAVASARVRSFIDFLKRHMNDEGFE